jgi:hypothetical protein
MGGMNLARVLWFLLLFPAVGCGRSALERLGSRSGDSGSGGGVDTGEPRDPKGAWGDPCSTDQDCRDDAICCDGSAPSCDATRLPAGDGVNPGELAYAADDLMVKDTITGLTWQRDVVTPRPGCSGRNGACTWSEAKAYCASLALNGVSGWRLPGRMELLTLVDYTRASPALDPRAFPVTPDNLEFWTSSPDADNPRQVWSISLAAGVPATDDETAFKKVRCVRGSRCMPKNRFAVLEDRLVQDRLTGLVWQQVVAPTTMTWYDAGTYCPTLGQGHRLPTVKELQSLVDLTATTRPRVDTTAFPNAPGVDGPLWTSTPYAMAYDAAWIVDFSSAMSYEMGDITGLWVRCVR